MSEIKRGELNPMFVKKNLRNAMQKSENKKGELNPMFGKPLQPHFSKFIEPTPIYVYNSVNKEL